MNTAASLLATLVVTLFTIGQPNAHGRAPADLTSFPFPLDQLEYPDYAKRNRTSDQVTYCAAFVEDLKRGKDVQIVPPRAESDTVRELEQRNVLVSAKRATS